MHACAITLQGVCVLFFFNELSKNYRALVWKNTEQDNRKYNVSKQLVL